MATRCPPCSDHSAPQQHEPAGGQQAAALGRLCRLGRARMAAGDDPRALACTCISTRRHTSAVGCSTPGHPCPPPPGCCACTRSLSFWVTATPAPSATALARGASPPFAACGPAPPPTRRWQSRWRPTPPRPLHTRRRVVVLVALVLVATGASAFTWTPCDKDVVPFTPDNVQLTPDPPVIGDSVTFSINGNAGEPPQRPAAWRCPGHPPLPLRLPQAGRRPGAPLSTHLAGAGARCVGWVQCTTWTRAPSPSM